MKNYFFFCLIAAVLISPVAKAQQAPDLRTQAVENTRKLAQQIALDDARTTKVKKLTYDRLVQETDLKQMYSIDPALLQSKLSVVEQEYAEKLKEVLSEAQYQRYLAIATISQLPVTATVPAAPAVAQPVPNTPKPAPQPVVQPKDKPAAPAGKPTSATHVSTISHR